MKPDYDFIINSYLRLKYRILKYKETEYGILLLTYCINHTGRPFIMFLIPNIEGFGGREIPDWDHVYSLGGKEDLDDAKIKYRDISNYLKSMPVPFQEWIKPCPRFKLVEWVKKPIV